MTFDITNNSKYLELLIQKLEKDGKYAYIIQNLNEVKKDLESIEAGEILRILWNMPYITRRNMRSAKMKNYNEITTFDEYKMEIVKSGINKQLENIAKKILTLPSHSGSKEILKRFIKGFKEFDNSSDSVDFMIDFWLQETYKMIT